MKFNLKKIGHFFTINNLWHKTFNEFTQQEIEELCETILSDDNKEIISRCYTCGSLSFWRFKGEENKKWTCIDCHPPATNKGLEFLKITIDDNNF